MVWAFRGMRKFNRYKQNLTQQGNKIWSYSTHVATIKGDELHQLGWWSVTTQKHINYVANELNLKLIMNKEKDELADRYFAIIEKIIKEK